ncbi:MAG: hypothetical protein K0R71_327 [Bacillales bacterium]|jgi:hypothetical protein|nr:hypothetical protein [Bacillales bacterium]
MSKRKKPKFQIGDIVVMVLYGTVGEITQVKEMEQSYVYEIDGQKGFYLESSLVPLDEFNENVFDYEQINIDYKFFFGDLVQVLNIGKELYKIVGFRTEIWRYQDESWEDVIYELSRVKDGDWLECAEEEITLVAEAKEADKYLKKQDLMISGKNSTQKQVKNKKKQQTKEIIVKPLNESQKKERIDHLLDLYNDYKSLKENFGDDEFQKVLQMIINKLKSLVE